MRHFPSTKSQINNSVLKNWTKKTAVVFHFFCGDSTRTRYLKNLTEMQRILGWSWNMNKSVTKKKSKALEIYFWKICRNRTQETSIKILTQPTPLVAPNMVEFCAKMKRNVNVLDSLPYPTEFSQNGHLSVVEKSSCYRAQFIVKICAKKNAGYPISFRAWKLPVTSLRLRWRHNQIFSRR